jgi:uncharacterized membrane protein
MRLFHLVILSLLLAGPGGPAPASGQEPPRPDPPTSLLCRGNEPFWLLRIEGARARHSVLRGAETAERELVGQARSLDWSRPPLLVWRGREERGAGGDLVAFVSKESCQDTMADVASPYSARVSAPDGAVLLGCCAPVARAGATTTPAGEPPAAAAPVVPGGPPAPSSEPPLVTAQRAEAPAEAAAAPAHSVAPASDAAPPTPVAPVGAVTAVELPDRRLCRPPDPPIQAQGRRLSFGCGRRVADIIGLVGPLEPDADLGFVAERVLAVEGHLGWEFLDAEPTAVRVVEIRLDEGLTCNETGHGATLAFGGQRASYSCGLAGGGTVALLGNLTPADGGFLITRAVIAHGPDGFSLKESAPILIAEPR